MPAADSKAKILFFSPPPCGGGVGGGGATTEAVLGDPTHESELSLASDPAREGNKHPEPIDRILLPSPWPIIVASPSTGRRAKIE
jgi:hypothetical protein